jgi:hypothetical protein
MVKWTLIAWTIYSETPTIAVSNMVVLICID